MSEQVGVITWISGPVVRARGSRKIGMLELVEVGEEHLVGEVIVLGRIARLPVVPRALGVDRVHPAELFNALSQGVLFSHTRILRQGG